MFSDSDMLNLCGCYLEFDAVLFVYFCLRYYFAIFAINMICYNFYLFIDL